MKRTFSYLIAAVVACLALMGCDPNLRHRPTDGVASPVSGAPLTKAEEFHIDSRLLMKCDESAKLENDRPVYSEDVLKAFGKTSNSLKACSARHQRLVDAVCKYLATGDLCKKP